MEELNSQNNIVEETVTEEPKSEKTRLIKSIGYNQHAIIRDILDLHCGGGENMVVVDPCYSIGNFYGHFKVKEDDGSIREFDIPQPTYKFDVNPQVEGCGKIDPWGSWPLDDNSVDIVILDPPFVIGPRDCASMKNGRPDSNRIGKRFSSFYPRHEMFETYEHLLHEAFRVLKDKGVLIFKTQGTVSGGINLMTPYYTCRVAEDLGFYILDEFVLLAKQRLISGKVKHQEHARKFHSFFYVFQKGNDKRNKTNYWKREFMEKHNQTTKEA